jgi:diaminohydroxyphosphoribosylaminopyrimidine deaminase/5-amino-6-(5-phosphoribosylamino)uracil reductase
MAVIQLNDEYWVQYALNLAWKGQFGTTPNPRVGCVFVRDNVAIAEGFHAKVGLAHAEVEAIHHAKVQGVSLLGSTAYVTLEPCAHYGRTGPCAEALIGTGVSRVVAAVLDPNPLVAGKGMAILKAAGIETLHGVLINQARWINRGFFSRMERHRPWVRLKVACSADGITALNNNVSQWITSEEARQDGHHLRAQACAVLSGIGTVKTDNPQLNVRGIDTERQPLKIIIDSKFEISPSALLLKTGKLLIVHTQHQVPDWLRMHPNSSNIDLLCLAPIAADLNVGPVKIDLSRLLQELALRHINELHLETGVGLNGAFLQAGLVDEIVQYIAPRFLGSGKGLFHLPEIERLPMKLDWRLHSFEQKGSDLRIVWVKNDQE